MSNASPPPVTRNRLITCILINQLATPGLGSMMARRFVSGIGQLLLAVAGSALIVVWMFQMFYRMTLQAMDEPAPHAANSWMWNWGLILFAASWLWSLVTSISLWMQARKLAAAEPRIPPRIS
jgi:hypothetical protein